MTDAEVGDIAERLARVEGQMRRYRAALVGVALIAAVGAGAPSLLGAAKVPATIQAKAFEVVDNAGTVRASLRTGGDGVGLVLYDKAGTPRLLATAGASAGLMLTDEAGKPRVELMRTVDDAQLTFTDKAGGVRAALGTVGDDTVLDLFDKSKTLRASLATTGDDVGLKLYDQVGQQRALLGNSELKNLATGSGESRPVSSLVLLRENGSELWQAP
ncbi:MAG: hypothetical protein IVW56_09945 [Candidatus Binataceae bacterium]|nr:hypothetical protein [Candidatus Binataceae bacterium]